MHRLMIAGILLLAGCAGNVASRAETPMPQGPVSPATCQADRFQGLIGRPELILQTTDLPAQVRIYQEGSPIKTDVEPSRLNFVFDGKRIIRKVNCG